MVPVSPEGWTLPGWAAYGADWDFEWTPKGPHLRGTPSIVFAIQAWISAHRSDSIAVTPTGPYLAADPGDPLVVLLALQAVGEPLYIWGDVPGPPSLPPGACG